MREILFRGKTVYAGKWVEGFYVKPKDSIQNHVIIDLDAYSYGDKYLNHIEFDDWWEVDPETVGQYTGLKDKNGKRIFEGDLINIVNSNKRGLPAVVRFNNRRGSYEIGRNGYNPIMLDYSEEIEVIGNIHDNPELLGGDKE